MPYTVGDAEVTFDCLFSIFTTHDFDLSLVKDIKEDDLITAIIEDKFKINLWNQTLLNIKKYLFFYKKKQCLATSQNNHYMTKVFTGSQLLRLF